MTRGSEPIPQEEALALVEQLRSGSRVASERIASAYIEWLAGRMRAIRPAAHEHLHLTAASDALMAFLKHPGRYDPKKGALSGYLFMAARGDLLNALESERGRHRMGSGDDQRPRRRVVELSDAEAEQRLELGDPALLLERREQVAEALEVARPRLPDAVAEKLTSVELQVLTLMSERARRTSDYAAVMGIEHLPPEAQRAAVKRMKDRLGKRVARGDGQHGKRA